MIIAIDTGGTKTLIVALSDEGEMLHKHQFPTPKSDEQGYLREIISTVNEMTDNNPPNAIVIGLPGVVQNQFVERYNNLDWYKFDVVRELQPNFPGVPIWIENDANLGAVGAAYLLPSLPHRCFYVTISTGIGGGYVVDGKIDPILAECEPADISFEYDGKLIRWEDLAAGPAIARTYNDIDLSKPTNEKIIIDLARRIARGFMTFIPILRPDVIVIGGGVGAYYHLFAEHVQKELSFLHEQYRYDIISTSHPQEVVIHGCYYYAKDKLGL